MGYKFYRNSLIKLGIIAFCLLLAFYDSVVNGKDLGDPRIWVSCTSAAFILSLWLAYKMRQAKKTPIPKPIPTSRHKRQHERKMVSIFACVAGPALIVLGMYDEWLWKPILLGGLIFLVGVAALSGVNIWQGGPLDPAFDPDE